MADIGIDEVRSVSGLGTNTTFVTGDTRYQMSRDWGVGGGCERQPQRRAATSWSLEGFIDRSNGGGTGRAQADVPETPVGRDTTLTLNETWSTPIGDAPQHLRLARNASAGAAFNDLQQDSTRVEAWQPFGGGQFSNGLESRAIYSGPRSVQGQAAPGVSANVSLTWSVGNSW